jgi:hypothetical protein
MSKHPPDDLELLIRNAELRTELEPYQDEAISRVNIHKFSVLHENEFLASMLAWETAPVLPIFRWFEPELRPPVPRSLSDEELSRALRDVVQRLFERHIVLDFADHLSDRELYSTIYCDILPSREKKIDNIDVYIHWDCSNANGDPIAWLTYYASDEDRRHWTEVNRRRAPRKKKPRHRRKMPRDPGNER